MTTTPARRRRARRPLPHHDRSNRYNGGCEWRDRQDRLHHQVPGRLLRHDGRRGEDVERGPPGGRADLRPGCQRHRRRGRDRGDRVDDHPRRAGDRHHTDEPERAGRPAEGRRWRHQGGPHRQRHPRLGRQDVRRRHGQQGGRGARRRVPGRTARRGRHHRHPRRCRRGAVTRRSRHRVPGGPRRRLRDRGLAAHRLRPDQGAWTPPKTSSPPTRT